MTRVSIISDSIQGQNSSKRNKSAIAAIVAAIAGIVLLTSQSAQALPSFARQTGQSCGACHTDFPQLTPFGRRFKLGGYTLGAGQQSEEYRKVFGSNQWVPPISMMAQITFEKQKTDPNQGTGVTTNNFMVPQGSIFYGGRITDELGAFVQATMDSSGAFLDNTDIRYVKTGSLFGKDVIFGLTAHNNPTVQDVWNTTPAWSMPGIGPSLVPGPIASTAIEGAFAGNVLGVGAYSFFDDKFYIEATAYKGFDQRWQNALINVNNAVGATSGNFAVMDRVSPYVRIAAEPHWGNHWLMIGAFWFNASVNPFYMVDPSTTVVGGSDKFVDLGFDTQYQYMGNNYVVTLRGSYIHEKQTLDATFNNGGSDNPTNILNSLKVQASFAWNTDAPGNKWVFTGGYFNTWGSTDCLLYQGTSGCPDPTTTAAFTGSANGSPNSDGWIAEIAWFPYAMAKSSPWPYFNARVGIQYTWFNKFNGATSNYDGNGRNASDNNTLLLYYWFAM